MVGSLSDYYNSTHVWGIGKIGCLVVNEIHRSGLLKNFTCISTEEIPELSSEICFKQFCLPNGFIPYNRSNFYTENIISEDISNLFNESMTNCFIVDLGDPVASYISVGLDRAVRIINSARNIHTFGNLMIAAIPSIAEKEKREHASFCTQMLPENSYADMEDYYRNNRPINAELDVYNALLEIFNVLVDHNFIKK